MKNLSNVRLSYVIVILLILSGLVFSGCQKKDDSNDMVPDNWLDNSYYGTLSVHYTNLYPAWDVTATMDVDIDKTTGLVTISSTTLSYSGVTLVSADSKIERRGSWSINPTGVLTNNPDNPDLNVDAGIILQNDVQKIYAKDSKGNWQMVNSTDFSGETPASDLSFNLNDAVIQGSVISVTAEGGSITWTLRLSVALD